MFNKFNFSSLAIITVLVLQGCGSPRAANDASSPSSSTSSTSGSVGSSSSSSASSSGSVDSPVPPLDDSQTDIDAEATEFFFSYDESASTASRDLTLAAIQNNSVVLPEWGRTYEYLNAEEFSHFNPIVTPPFSVSMGLYKSEVDEIAVGQEYTGDLYTLGVNISGPVLSKEERPNVVLTLLVDISGSMNSPYAEERWADITSLLDVTKYALKKLSLSLKDGDILNMVTFEDYAETVFRSWTFDATDDSFDDAVNSLRAYGSTNLDAGISLAYQVAQESYDETKSNRVVIFTDAYANTGQTETSVIAENTVINNLEGIYLSGVGIGSDFNDRFLNELTDIGKGTYSAMITPEDAERIVTDGFMRFLDSALSDVKFKLTYPQSLDQLQTAAEDISTDESEVSEINFSFNSSQFFLEIFNGSVELTDELVFSATFVNGGVEQSIEVKKTAEELLSNGTDEIKSAVMVTRLAKIVGGDISCGDVQFSGIYSQNIVNDIFQTYRKATSDYCGPSTGELALPGSCTVVDDRVLCR